MLILCIRLSHKVIKCKQKALCQIEWINCCNGIEFVITSATKNAWKSVVRSEKENYGRQIYCETYSTCKKFCVALGKNPSELRRKQEYYNGVNCKENISSTTYRFWKAFRIIIIFSSKVFWNNNLHTKCKRCHNCTKTVNNSCGHIRYDKFVFTKAIYENTTNSRR